MWDSNVYYNPEKFGLTLLGSADLSEPNYSFDMLAVWKDENGFYLATDSGCSCPAPFENYNGVGDLTGPLTPEQVKDEALELWMGSYSPEYEPDEFWALMALVE